MLCLDVNRIGRHWTRALRRKQFEPQILTVRREGREQFDAIVLLIHAPHRIVTESSPGGVTQALLSPANCGWLCA
jgi:hypothetical protein